jgi:hypothetical protein
MTSIGKCSGPSTMFSTLVISMAQRSGPNAAVIACHFPTDRPSAGSSLWFCSVPEKGLTVRRLAAGAKEIRTHGPTPNASVPRAPHGSRNCSRFRSRALLRGLGGCESKPEVSLLGPPPSGILRLSTSPMYISAREPPWFSLSSSAPRTTPLSRAGARFEQVVACGAARQLPPAGGSTHIYLRSPSARPAIR